MATEMKRRKVAPLTTWDRIEMIPFLAGDHPVTGPFIHPKVGYAIMDITPDGAMSVLEKRSDGNRRIKQRQVSKIRRAIERGEWEENGQTIVLDQYGWLLDGQHRLFAIMEAEQSVRALVVWGVTRAAQHSIDGGTARSPSDFLVMNGYRCANQTRAICNLLLHYDRRLLDKRRTTDSMSAQEMLEMMAAYDIPLSLELSSPCKPLRSGCGAFLAVAIKAGHSREALSEFVDAVVNGDAGGKKSPANILRKRLDDRNRRKTRSIEAFALWIKAFDFWRKGEQRQVLVWRDGAEFPYL